MRILVLCTGTVAAAKWPKVICNTSLENADTSAGRGDAWRATCVLIAVMKDGVDIGHHTSTNVDEYAHIAFYHAIMVCGAIQS